MSDLHWPDTIDLGGICKFIKDEKPDEIIYIGDIINATGISKYTTKTMEDGIYETVGELEGFRDNVHLLLKACAPNAKFTLIGGNHEEQRIWKAIKENPERRKLLDLKTYLKDVRIVEYGKFHKVGDLYYTHGNFYGDTAPKKHLQLAMRNVVFGHTHTVSEYTMRSPTDTEPICAKNIGCLCDRNPDYMRNQYNAWVHAFHIAYINTDGSYYDYTIKLNKGKFLFNGKIYQ